MDTWIIEASEDRSPQSLSAHSNTVVLRLQVDGDGPVAKVRLASGQSLVSGRLARIEVDDEANRPSSPCKWTLGRTEGSRPSIWARGVAGELVRSVCLDLEADGEWIGVTEKDALVRRPQRDGTSGGRSLTTARRRIWQRGAAGSHGISLDKPPAEYAGEIYPPILRDLWAETELDGTRVGAITNNRSYHGDVWFSCWFNTLRASYGLFHYGRVLDREDWVESARGTRSLALHAPSTGNLFPTVFAFGHNRWVESHHQGGGPGIFHLMDMSWSMSRAAPVAPGLGAG